MVDSTLTVATNRLIAVLAVQKAGAIVVVHKVPQEVRMWIVMFPLRRKERSDARSPPVFSTKRIINSKDSSRIRLKWPIFSTVFYRKT